MPFQSILNISGPVWRTLKGRETDFSALSILPAPKSFLHLTWRLCLHSAEWISHTAGAIVLNNYLSARIEKALFKPGNCSLLRALAPAPRFCRPRINSLDMTHDVECKKRRSRKRKTQHTAPLLGQMDHQKFMSPTAEELISLLPAPGLQVRAPNLFTSFARWKLKRERAFISRKHL